MASIGGILSGGMVSWWQFVRNGRKDRQDSNQKAAEELAALRIEEMKQQAQFRTDVTKEVAELRADCERLNRTVDDERKKRRDLEDEVGRGERAREDLVRRMGILQAENSRLTTENEALTAKVHAMQEHISTLERKVQAADTRIQGGRRASDPPDA